MSIFKSERKGFTLIELLVVITIIVILAAILFPVFARVRRAAQKTNCLNNMKQIGTAIQMYTQDWDECYPLVSGFGPYIDNISQLWNGSGFINVRGNNIATARWMPNLIAKYINSPKIFTCPSIGREGEWYVGGQSRYFRYNFTRYIYNSNADPDTTILSSHPDLTPATDPICTYIFNAWVWSNAAVQSNPAPSGTKTYISGQSEAACLRPADAPLVWDGISGRLNRSGDKIQLAHPDSINVVYADGHAKTVSISSEPAKSPAYTDNANGKGHFWFIEGWKGWLEPM
jgi:prepilin-type N-terminal cleavage/methylation domain-containing protein/prepilin-type processing-associated H-X9-DG protein